MKSLFLALFFLGMGSSVWSQTALECEDGADLGDPLDKLICGEPSLLSAHGAMAQIWEVWQTGINKDRIDYLRGEQSDWMQARSECLSEPTAAECLQARYQERLAILSGARIYQSAEVLDGKTYDALQAMSPLRYSALFIENSLSANQTNDKIIDNFRPKLTAPLEEDCGLCTHERHAKFDRAYLGASLEIVSVKDVEQFDEEDEVTRYQSLFFDRSTGKEIGFLDIFEPSTLPFVKNNLIEMITSELDRLNKALPNNEQGQTQYYWKEIDLNLQGLNAQQWGQMGFYPVVENGLIIGFKYRSDDYEFAPYGSSGYFSGFYLDAMPLVPFIKAQYQDNFK